MRRTAGLVVIYRGSILLVRQYYDTTNNHLSIPKGEARSGESLLNAAIRETEEETGVKVPIEYIDPEPHLLNINNAKLQRRIVYFVAKFPNEINFPIIEINDRDEIKWAGLVECKSALSCIQRTQLTVLFHLDERKIYQPILDNLLECGYITKANHPTVDLFLYNYTDKCKKEEYWNDVTLWCRGLILNADNEIKYHPFKKFFEYQQLYPEFLPLTDSYKVYEKKDGFLGIMYWVNGFPFIATRDSFISYPAINANILLYTKYNNFLSRLSPSYTYLFEIVYPNDFLIIDYGKTEDLFLISVYDNEQNQEIPLENVNIPFPRVRTFELKQSLPQLLSHNVPNEEGYVLLYPDGFRIKIKFNNYKNKYVLKHEK